MSNGRSGFRIAWDTLRLLAAAFLAALAAAPAARAQIIIPVYVDDSPAAADSLARAGDFIASGNVDEAVRVIQKVISEEGDRLVVAEGEEDLFISARARTHDLLLSKPVALERYRAMQGGVAQRRLDEGAIAQVEHDWLLTTAGFEAALRLAQSHIESGAFEAARQTLEQLERHPDRLGPLGADAAQLLTLAARYIGRPEVVQHAQRWRREAGLDPAPETAFVAPPPPEFNRSLSPLETGPQVDLTEIVSKPLWSEPLADEPEPFEDLNDRRAADPEAASARAQLLYMIPVVAGDTVYVNDAESVWAWDRFTMALRWKREFSRLATPRSLASGSRQRMIEDLSSVTVFGPWVIAPTGLAQQGSRDGDDRVHALDTETGETRWSVQLPRLDPALEDASIRGPAVIDQGVVVLSTVKKTRTKRLDGIYLVGLDLGSGALRWRRQVGSVGALPYTAGARVSEPVALRHGVVYAAGRLGVAAAVESVSGRPIWVRRIQTESASAGPTDTWQVDEPRIIGDVMYAIAPNRASILAIDTASGRILSERWTTEFGRARHLLSNDATIFGVSDTSVFALDVAHFADESVKPRLILQAPAIRGRVVAAGDGVLAPVTNGLLVARADAESAENAQFIPLDHSGNFLALQSQVVVVDDVSAHSYLIWGVAERMLQERMAAEAHDAAPAATYAELAFRAGRPDRILPAVDSALTAIEARPLDERNQEARRRLFEASLEMVDPDPRKTTIERVSPELAAGLIDRLGRLASTPQERVRRLMVEGEHGESTRAPGAAVKSYQTILLTPMLASAQFERHGVTYDAEEEATRRLRRAVRDHGRAIYAQYESEAERELAAAAGSLDPDRFSAVARRYPLATCAPKAWLEAAAAFSARGKPNSAIFALERGLFAAEETLSADNPLVGELAGRLVQALAKSDRLAAASATLKRALDRWPGLILTESGATVDIASLSADLAARLARLDRLPVIGLIPPGRDGETNRVTTQTLEQWRITPPILAPRSAAAAEFIVLANEERGELGVWSADPRGGVRMLWSTGADQNTSFLHMGDDAIYLAHSSDRGPSVLKHDLATGRLLWTTPPLRQVFPPDPDLDRLVGARQNQHPEAFLDTPLDPRVPLGQALAAVDSGVLVLVERSGRAAAFDLATGQRLWAVGSTVAAVHDVAAGAGFVVIGGAPERHSRVVDNERIPGGLVALDIRTGRSVGALASDHGEVHWIRMTPEGDAVVGMKSAVACYDLFQARPRWSLTDPPSRETVDAWVFPGRVVTASDDGRLWQIDVAEGRRMAEPLESRGRVSPIFGGASGRAFGDRAVFASPLAVLAFDREGRLVGMDHRPDGAPQTLRGRFSERYVATIEIRPYTTDPTPLYGLSLVEPEGGSLAQRALVRLGEEPTELAVVNGRVLITAGNATLVIDAPPGD